MKRNKLKNINSRSKLYIFNLSIDDNNPILAFTSEWVSNFANHFTEVEVYCTHLGVNSLSPSIKVIEIGGGSLSRRLIGLKVLFLASLNIIRNRKKSIVFHHMSPRTALLIGPIIKIFKVPQGLWYSHSRATKELKISARIVDKLFSSTKESLPINSKKSRFFGHGIDLSKYPKTLGFDRIPAVLSLGRISKIKNNEALIYAIASARLTNRVIHLVGPTMKNPQYLDELIAIGNKCDVQVVYLGEVDHSQINSLMSRYQICYTGNPNTVDKSVIEAALSGCFILASQEFILQQTGMSEVVNLSGRRFEPSLEAQIKFLDEISSNLELREVIQNEAAKRNDVVKLTFQITRELQNT